MLPVNEKSTATSDVILNKALTKLAYHKKKRIHEGLEFILLFPGTTEALKNAEKTLENCTTISAFLLPVK